MSREKLRVIESLETLHVVAAITHQLARLEGGSVGRCLGDIGGVEDILRAVSNLNYYGNC